MLAAAPGGAGAAHIPVVHVHLVRHPAAVRVGLPAGTRAVPICAPPTTIRGSCDAVELVTPNDTGNGAASPPSGSITPQQLHDAYELPLDAPDVGTPPAPPTVAVVELAADPNAGRELATYSSQYGLPACPLGTGTGACFRQVDQQGQDCATSPVTGNPNAPCPFFDTNNDAITASAYETALDVQAIHSICENCQIVNVEATPNPMGGGGTAGIDQASQAVVEAASLAQVISISFGFDGPGAEPAMTSADFKDFDQPNRVIVVASGDYGQVTSEDYPSANPYVVAAGGTKIALNADGTYNSEEAWSEQRTPPDPLIASGSDCSATYSATSWQAGDLPDYTALGCLGARATSDVSAQADPGVALYLDEPVVSGGDASGWYRVGGTSLAAPTIAGVFALAGGYPSGLDCPMSESCAAESLYNHAHDAVPSLHDVTTGAPTNSGPICTQGTICQAAPGLDGPTGLGTPWGLGAFGGPMRLLATTEPATDVTMTSATLNGLLDTQGSSASAWFKLGTDTTYGTTTGPLPATTTAAVSTAPFAVTVTGLTPGTTYHFKLQAARSVGDGPAAGDDITFQTIPAPVAPGAPSNPPSPTHAKILHCVVPHLQDLTAAKARRALRAAHCALGRLTKPHGRAGRLATVIVSQSRRPGVVLAVGAKIGGRLGAPPKRRRGHTVRP